MITEETENYYGDPYPGHVYFYYALGLMWLWAMSRRSRNPRMRAGRVCSILDRQRIRLDDRATVSESRRVERTCRRGNELDWRATHVAGILPITFSNTHLIYEPDRKWAHWFNSGLITLWHFCRAPRSVDSFPGIRRFSGFPLRMISTRGNGSVANSWDKRNDRLNYVYSWLQWQPRSMVKSIFLLVKSISFQGNSIKNIANSTAFLGGEQNQL